MLSEEELSEGQFSAVEASLYPHDSPRAPSLLRLHHGKPFRNPIRRFHRQLHKRIFEHKFHQMEGSTNKYDVERLLYRASFDDVHKAIAREKQLKVWSRAKKVALIESRNPHWLDLAEDWYPWMQSSADVRDASTAENRPSDDPPPLSMTNRKADNNADPASALSCRAKSKHPYNLHRPRIS